MSTVPFTAAICCYNAQRDVRRAIRSLQMQTAAPAEILVIDDGSTDSTAHIAETCGARVVGHRRNRGLGAARRTAVAEARGEYILFIDADAEAAPDLIQHLHSGYDAPGVAGVGGQGIEVEVHSRYDRWRQIHFRQSFGPHKWPDCPFLFGLCSSYQVAAVRRVGSFHQGHRTNGEDVEIGDRFRRAGYRLNYDPVAVVYHHRTDHLRSLMRAGFRYEYWCITAGRRHGPSPVRVHFSRLTRQLLLECYRDLDRLRSPCMSLITLLVRLSQIAGVGCALTSNRQLAAPRSTPETDAP